MNLYGIEDELEIKHLLGYLTQEQWEDAFIHANELGLEMKKLAEYKEIVEKQNGVEKQ